MSLEIEVEVVFASPNRQILRQLLMPAGSTAADAITLAGLCETWLASPAHPLPLGRFGRLIAPGQVLSSGDRVEILRPLQADPKAQRHQRVKAARQRRARAINGP